MVPISEDDQRRIDDFVDDLSADLEFKVLPDATKGRRREGRGCRTAFETLTVLGAISLFLRYC